MTDVARADEVVVTDIRMRFGSMVVFMVKWAIAAIPAFVILAIVGAVFWSLVVGAVIGSHTLSGAVPRPSSTDTSQSESAGPPAPPETVAYLQNVEIIGLRVGSGLTGKGVFGEVKNNGTRSLSQVEITVYCLGSSGKPVFEKKYHPVFVSSLSIGQDNEPLKAGYSRKFGVRLDDAPSDWAGNIDAKVTAVEFVAR